MQTIELSGEWFKSSFSGPSGPNCVEVAPLVGGGVAMRDSKDPAGVPLQLTAAQWQVFLRGLKAGQFNLA
jgi:hypothetical protein